MAKQKKSQAAAKPKSKGKVFARECRFGKVVFKEGDPYNEEAKALFKEYGTSEAKFLK